MGVDVVAGHLDHGQRPESKDEADRCAEFVAGLGIGFVKGLADVPAIAHEHKIGLEEAGRKARYAWFASARAATSCSLVATAHTLDDHVETVLFHLARGTGLDGLAGIAERFDGGVRPMLGFRRRQTRAYCEELGLWFHDDPSNSDLSNSRTRIRMMVVPELEAAHPGAVKSMARLARIVTDESAFLDGIGAGLLESAEVRLNGALWFLTKDCEAAFDLDRLIGAPRVAAVRAVRLLAGHFGAKPDNAATLALLDALTMSQGSWTLEGGGSVFEWSEGRLHARVVRPDGPLRDVLPVPGRYESGYFGWALESTSVGPNGSKRPRECLEAIVDGDSVIGPLHVRAAVPGDAVAPIGLNGTKKLSDLFQESRLTHAARTRLPIVCDMAGPVWVPGIALAERVKITENSRQGLLFHLAPFPT